MYVFNYLSFDINKKIYFLRYLFLCVSRYKFMFQRVTFFENESGQINTFSYLFLCRFSVVLRFNDNFVWNRVGSNIIRFHSTT
ncbi:hypothetical protein Hanom_Chr05g00429711 [Helianthus anomalus]